jgi:hypothetical protein
MQHNLDLTLGNQGLLARYPHMHHYHHQHLIIRASHNTGTYLSSASSCPTFFNNHIPNPYSALTQLPPLLISLSLISWFERIEHRIAIACSHAPNPHCIMKPSRLRALPHVLHEHYDTQYKVTSIPSSIPLTASRDSKGICSQLLALAWESCWPIHHSQA